MVVPFVKDKLSGSECLDFVDKISLTNSPRYSCFDDSVDEYRVQIHIGDVNKSLQSIVLEFGGASSKTINIEAGNANADNIWMYDKTDSDALELPGSNEERTYVFSSTIFTNIPESIRVYPKLKGGKTCPSSGELAPIPLCTI